MTFLDPRAWYTHAMANVYETNDTDKYPFHARVRSNLTATFACIAALGAQILICAAKSIAGPVGKVIHYKDAPSLNDWVETAQKIWYYTIALFQTALATVCSFVTPSLSRNNVANQYARKLIDDPIIHSKVEAIKGESQTIIDNVTKAKKILADMENAMVMAKLGPRSHTPEERMKRAHLMTLHSRLDYIDKIYKWNLEAQNLLINPDSIQWDMKAVFLYKEQRIRTQESFAAITQCTDRARELCKTAKQLHIKYRNHLEESLKQIYSELLRLDKQAIEQLNLYNEIYDSTLEDFQALADALQCNDCVNMNEALERVKADLSKLFPQVQQFPALQKQFIPIYALLEEPIWTMVSKDNKELANWMDDNLREQNEMVSKDEMLFSELKKIADTLTAQRQAIVDYDNPTSEVTGKAKADFLQALQSFVERIKDMQYSDDSHSHSSSCSSNGEMSDGEASNGSGSDSD